MPSPYKRFTVTLPTTGAASGAITLEGYTPVAVQMSTAFTGTKLHFEASYDDTNFRVLTSSTGGEVQATVAASKYVSLYPFERFYGLQALKIRPGVSTAASTQAAARTVYLVARPMYSGR